MKKTSIYSLAIVLGLLIFWFLGFILDDLNLLPGLQFEQYSAPIKHSALQLQENKLNKQIDQLRQKISDTQTQRDILSTNMQNTQSILNQIVNMQKLQAGSNSTKADKLVDTFKKNTELFLQQQNQLQQLNQNLAGLNNQLLPLQNQREYVVKKLYKLYNTVEEKYLIKLGAAQIILLLVLLILTSFILKKQRNSPYRIIWLAINLSVCIKIFFVIYQCFPSQYFKYILILSLIIVVWIGLIKLIHLRLIPNRKQYRIAYAKSLCGVCEFPITRKNTEPYTCPDCGTQLFEKCQQCQQTKHSLLSYCEHCGTLSQQVK